MVNQSLSVVIIGRNEGAKLHACVESVRAAKYDGTLEIVYVDSRSTDGSVAWAVSQGLRVIELAEGELSAARARNSGWISCESELVLFLDGDTVLMPKWPMEAASLFEYRTVAVVWGIVKEIHPRQSVYNRVVDLDWYYPVGNSEFCGGNAMMRRSALLDVGGFDESLRQGEEPELCARLRSSGWTIYNNGSAIAGHDLEMRSFQQYWRRGLRSGLAMAQVSERFARSARPLWRREARRNLVHAAVLLGLLALALFAMVQGLVWTGVFVLLFLALLVLRTALRARVRGGDTVTHLLYGVHSHFIQIPIAVGQLQYHSGNRRRGNS